MSNEEKSRALGMNFGTANQRLRKLIMWTLVCKTDQNVCFRCEQRIEDIDDLSIEHKEPWQSADDPKAAFFDLENVTFSHLKCNVGAANRDKERCPEGHQYDEANTHRRNGRRHCRECDRVRSRVYWHRAGRAKIRRKQRHNSE